MAFWVAQAERARARNRLDMAKAASVPHMKEDGQSAFWREEQWNASSEVQRSAIEEREKKAREGNTALLQGMAGMRKRK